MRTKLSSTLSLGELIATVYEEASQYSSSPEEVSRLATTVVQRLVRQLTKASPARTPARITPQAA